MVKTALLYLSAVTNFLYAYLVVAACIDQFLRGSDDPLACVG